MKRLKLIQKRFELGLSLTRMSKRTGLAPSTLLNVEHGGMPQPRTIPVLAKAYGLPSSKFVAILFENQEEGK